MFINFFRFYQLGLCSLVVDVDDEDVAGDSKAHHDEVDGSKEVVSGWRLRWKMQPVLIDSPQEAFADFSFEVRQSGDVAAEEEKKI
jgi:hypothetical protein